MTKEELIDERRQAADENRYPYVSEDVGIFWEGYQAAVHDMLHALDCDSTTLTLIAAKWMKS